MTVISGLISVKRRAGDQIENWVVGHFEFQTFGQSGQ
jgi:hypothetical protein